LETIGLGIAKQYKLSPQGIEATFATNVVGHQVLVTLLLPLLKKTIVNQKTDVRIVVTSSSLHGLCRHLDLDLLKSPTPTKPAYYDGIWRYGRSKLGDILFARALSRRLLSDRDPTSKNIYVNAYFPGNIVTNQMDVWKEYLGSFIGWIIKTFVSTFGQSTEDGAATAMYLAASKEICNDAGTHGEYFIPIATKHRTTAIAEDMILAQRLWVRRSMSHLSGLIPDSSSVFP
jgi:NAD(P)-dependent dehydrogenase (short-subunit alcohol dehydrogenase family)